MSREGSAELESLIAELAEIKKYVESLQNTITQLAAELQEVRLSRGALEALSNLGSIESLISLDRRGHTYVKGVIGATNTVVAHIGSNYYAEVPVAVAIKLLNDKESDVMKSIQLVQGELNKVLTYYHQLQELISRALSRREVESSSR